MEKKMMKSNGVDSHSSAMKRRRLLSAAAVLLICCLAFVGAAGAEEWYDPTATEYIIDSKEDLLAFAAAVNTGDTFAGKTVKLGAEIDLSGIEWSPIGGDSVYFAGEFDGQGYTISGLTQTTGTRMGLFGLVEKAYLHDFTMEDVLFTVSANNARVGAVAGNLQYWNVLEDITIDDIKIIINGNDGLVGTVTGYAWKSQLGNVDVKNAVFIVNGEGNVIGGHTAYGRAHVWDTGVTGNNAHWLEGTVQTIDGVEYVLQNYFAGCDVDGVKMTLNGDVTEAGGFFGSDTYNSHSNYFVNSHVTGLDVTCADGTSQTVGGFVAWNGGTTAAGTVKGFDGCSVSGTIKGANGIYGGFVGSSGGRAHSYSGASADVDITCTGYAGGFVGKTQAYSTHKYTFTDCSATGDVKGNVAGGFAGCNGLSGDGKSVYVAYNGCSASGKVEGSTYAGGFIGEVNPELPATNWNTVDSTGNLDITGCSASTDVSTEQNGKIGSLIGYFDAVANGDAIEGNKILLGLGGNTYPGNAPYNASDDTPNDVAVPYVASVSVDGNTPKYYKTLADAISSIDDNVDSSMNVDIVVFKTETPVETNIEIPGGKTITIRGETGKREDVTLNGQIATTASNEGTLTIKDLTFNVDDNIKDSTGISQTGKSAIAIWGDQTVICDNLVFEMTKPDSSAITSWWDTGIGTSIVVKDSIFNCNGQRPIRATGNVDVQDCVFNDPYRYAVQLTAKASTATLMDKANIVFKNNEINNGKEGKDFVYGIQLEGETYGCSDLVITGEGNTINAGEWDKNSESAMYCCECGKVNHGTTIWNTNDGLPEHLEPETVLFSVSPDVTSVDFGTVQLSYTPTDIKVNLTNNGDSGTTITEITGLTHFEVSVSTSHLEAGKNATLTVTPKINLPAGTHTDTLFISIFGIETPITIPVTITVTDSSDDGEIILPEIPEQPSNPSSGGDGGALSFPRTTENGGLVDFGSSKVVQAVLLPEGSRGSVLLKVDTVEKWPKALETEYTFDISVEKLGDGMAYIHFEIPVSALESLELTPADICAYHFEGEVWTKLPTTYEVKDGTVCYEAATDSFSPFKLVIEEGAAVLKAEENVPVIPPTETPDVPDEPEILPPIDEPTKPADEPETPAPILAVLAGLGAAFIVRRK